MTQTSSRKAERSWETYRRDKYLRQISLGAALVVIGVIIGYFLFASPPISDEYNLSLFTGLLGIFVTVFILDRLSERRSVALEKQTLIAQLASPDNIITRQAIKILWARGWLQDGSAQHANLWEANIERGDLGECDLRHANFKRANLRGARLWARLDGASLIDADLTGAWLIDPYDLDRKATLDAYTILPDGTSYAPELGLDQLNRFTQANRKDHFYSSDPRSPAYKEVI